LDKDKTQLLLENIEVFEETLNEFSSKPYDLASVNEIIKRSSYNKGSFYYRFKDKYELYTSLLDYVFVQQIEIYNQSGFSLINEKQPELIIKHLFNNLIQLYSKDSRYYDLVKRFYNEPNDFILEAHKVLVQSLFVRFIDKLKHLGYQSKINLFLIESIYKNFPIEEIHEGLLNLDEITNQMTDKQVYRILNRYDQKNNVLTQIDLTNINIIYAKPNELDIPPGWVNMNSYLDRIKKIQRQLNRKLMMFKFDVKKVLIHYQNKPIFCRFAIEKLLNKQALDCILSDKLLYDLLVILIHLIVELEEQIVIEGLISQLNPNQQDVFVNQILPIVGKLSKIIMIEESIIFDHNHHFNYFYFDGVSTIKPMNLPTSINHRQFYVKYKQDDAYHTSVYHHFSDLSSLVSKANVVIIDLKTLSHLNINDIREVVDQL